MKDIGLFIILISIISIINFTNLGKLNNFNLIYILLSLELFLLGVSLLFISYALYFDDLYGVITALFILTIGAAESAIGLSIITRLSNKD